MGGGFSIYAENLERETLAGNLERDFDRRDWSLVSSIVNKSLSLRLEGW